MQGYLPIFKAALQVSQIDRGILGSMGSGKWFGSADSSSSVAMATVIAQEDTLYAVISAADFRSGTMALIQKPEFAHPCKIEAVVFDPCPLGTGTFAKVCLWSKMSALIGM